MRRTTMAQRILFQDFTLEQERKDLLALMVEAQRTVPREQWTEYFVQRMSGGETFFYGPGMNTSGVVPSDLDALADWGLLRPGFTSSGNSSYDITPDGRRYYEWMKLEQGQPAERVEIETRQHLEGDEFRKEHPRAYDKWSKADTLLWGADTETAFTQIGLYSPGFPHGSYLSSDSSSAFNSKARG
jgi:hypothetical protein